MKKLLIVIVDDNEVICMCQRDLCEDLCPKADVVGFSSAIGVLSKIDHFVAEYRKVIVITDFDMPRMSGVELIMQLHARGYDKLPIIMISGCNQAMSDAAKLKVPFLEKPFRDEDLEFHMRTLIHM